MELTVVRHAQAEHRGATDFDRPLSKAGLAQAKSLGMALRGAITPQLLLHSTACRAQQTAQGLGFSCATVGLFELYSTDPFEMVQLVENMAHSHHADSVLVVGHEPVISSVAYYLTGQDSGAAPTATAFLLTGSLESGGMELVERIHIPPRL